MNKLSYNRTLGWIVLVCAIVGAGLIGWLRKDSFESRKATELLDVQPYHWVQDSAKLLSGDTKDTVDAYNAAWNEQYHAVIAVATIPTLNGWKDGMEYGKALGQKWGLGSCDMLLLLVEDEYWYAVLGDNVLNTIYDNNQEAKLESAMSTPYYQGDFDGAVEAFFRQADVYYAQAFPHFVSVGGDAWDEPVQTPNDSGVSVFGVILLIAGILVVWALLDRVRYNRYRRRTVVVGAPRVTYYPIFWGRPSAPRHPYRPAPPLSPRRSGQPPRSGGTVRRSAPPASRPSSRPGSGFGGGGFGGSRSSGGGRGGSFGGGGFGGGKRR